MEVHTILYVERGDNDEEIKLYVFGEVTPFVPGNRRGSPDNWTPDEPAYVGINGLYLDKDENEPWTGTLRTDEEDRAEQYLVEAYENHVQRMEEERAEAREIEREEAKYRDSLDDNDYGPYGPDIYDF